MGISVHARARSPTRSPSFPTNHGPMKTSLALLAVTLALGAGAVQADPAVDNLSRCLADNSTGKERKLLARWVFVAMGAHPELRDNVPIPPAMVTDTSRAAGETFNRLLADACPTQARAAIQAVGQRAFQQAFSVLGQLALQEIMTDPGVAASLLAMQQHLDRARLEPLLKPK